MSLPRGLLILGTLMAACGGDVTGGGDSSGQDGGGGAGGDGGTAGDSLRARVSPELPVIGAAVAVDHLADDAGYAELAGREFNSVTPENAMKWEATEPSQGAFTFDGADAIVEFAEEHDQRVRGHTLVWHQQLPAWVTDALTAEELGAAMDARIDALLARYRGRVATWDVVNEAIDDRGLPRDTLVLRKLGLAYIARAFRRARAADPDAELVYNDYGIEELTPKSDAVYALVADLVARGVPIDAVGIQFHVGAYDLASFDLREADIRANVQRFAALGLAVHFTEMDVRITSMPGDLAARLDHQRRVYQLLTAICSSEPGCTSLTFWGFTDRFSWIDGAIGPDDPLLYDDDLERKPAYQGVSAGMSGDAGEGGDIGLETACGAALAGAPWCAPFESATLDSITFGRDYLVQSGGVAAIATADPFAGARSLRVTAGPAAGAQALVGRGALTPVTDGTIHLRAQVKVPASVAADSVTFLSLGEAAPPYAGVGVGMFEGKFQLSLTTAGSFPVSAVSVPRDTWHCIQLDVKVSDAAGTVALRLDGTTIQSLTGVDTRPAGGISNGNAGVLYNAPAGATGEVWFDEVALATTPLPCE
jgi:endo-1,4-beta-xylanase